MIRQFILILLLGLSVLANAQTDRSLIRDGNGMYRKQDYAKAEVLYRKAVSKNPSNPQAVYNLGCALMMQNKDSAAIVQYQNAAKLEKNKSRLASVYHNIGVICQNHKMYDDAIKAYEQSLRNNPSDEETRYNLALCKQLRKKQGGKNNSNDEKNQQDENGNKDEQQKDKDNKNEEKKQPEPKEQMSKDNAEQMLNAAMQQERATQQRLKEATRKPSGSRVLQKNW